MRNRFVSTLSAAIMFAALLCNVATASTQLKSSIVPESTDTTRIERTQDGTILYWMKDEAGVWQKAVELAVHDLIEVSVAVSVSFDEATEEYEYHYTVVSDASSSQRIDTFGLWLESIPEAEGVYGYSFTDSFGTSSESDWAFKNMTDSDIWYWDCLPPFGINPASKETRFFFRTPGQPGIVTCFAIGANNVPPDQAWDVNFPVPAMEDRGVKGITIGPVPVLYDPEKLAERLLGYLPVCLGQGWLSQRARDYLQEKLGEIRLDFSEASWNLDDAGIKLEQCIQCIAGLHENEITQEGRILLDFNLRCLKTFAP